MVKTSTVRFVLLLIGFLTLIGILLSETGNTSKTIGSLLAIILIVLAVVITGPLIKHFKETKQGTIDPNEGQTF